MHEPIDSEAPLTWMGAAKPAEPQVEPKGWLWLYYLFFRPDVFFQHFVQVSQPRLTALCALLYGVYSAVGEISSDAILSPDQDSPVTAHWAAFWAVAGLGGVVAAVLLFVVGGWWYRLRLRWSGAQAVDKRLARRVYLFSSMVETVPGLSLLASVSTRYRTPAAYFAAPPELWDSLWLPFGIWSAWVSYRGAWKLFGLHRGRARLWLLVLPGVVCGVFGGLLLAAALMPRLLAADVTRPQGYEGPVLVFTYPGNWTARTEGAPEHAADAIAVESWISATVYISLYRSGRTLQEEVGDTVAMWRDHLEHPRVTAEFATWGRYDGVGRVVRGILDGWEHEVRIFAHRTEDDYVLEVIECLDTDEADWVTPGFKLIEETLRLKAVGPM